MIAAESLAIHKQKDLKIPILSMIFPVSVLMYFIVVSEPVFHWFVIPVLFCGIITAYDSMKWLTGKYDVFDPMGIIGLMGFHFFFLCPLLNVHWDLWMGLVVPPDDWRPWLGCMAILNFIGLFFFRFFALKFSKGIPFKTKWVFNRKKGVPILIAFISISAIAQLYFYKKVGGLMQLIQISVDTRKELLDGNGLLITISECFPILLVFLLIFSIKNKLKPRSMIIIVFLILLFFALKMYFGGFRGSRNSTIWFLFWICAIFHNFIRPFSRKIIFIGIIFITCFMFIYGFYKSGGVEGLRSAFGSEQGAETSDRSVRSLLVADYGRSDIQALILQKLNTTDYPLAWGKSYIGDISILVPSFIAGEKYPTKRKYGTDIQFYGTGMPRDDFISSKIYGLSGEWMINFGWLSMPIAFILFGIFTGLVRKRYLNWDRDDARRLILPLFLNLSFLIIVNDLDNHIFFLVKNGAIAMVAIYLCTDRIKIRQS